MGTQGLGIGMQFLRSAQKFRDLFTLLAFLVISSAASAEGAQMAPVGVDKVNVAEATETSPIVGRIVGLQQGTVAARTAGIVDKILVRVGDAVNEGDILAVLDQSLVSSNQALTEATVSQWKARLSSAEAALELANRDLKRAENLKRSSAFNKSEYDKRQTDMLTAKATVTEAIASLQFAQVQKRMADTDFSYTEIRAPFDGIVAARNVNVGAWANKGAKVIELVNPQLLEVEAEIPSQQAAALAPATKIRASTSAKQNFDAILRTVVPIENPSTHTRLARFEVALDNGLNLAINQSLTLHVPVNNAKLLSVHKDAVIRNGNASLVYKVSEGVAVITPVGIGRAVGDRFEVHTGLEQGDVVVVRGNERLRPGQKVMYPGMNPVANINTPASF